MELPWLEKYRPAEIADLVGNRQIVDHLRALAERGSVPHMLFAGPPGIGKTTAALCLVRSVLGAALAKDAVLELNASDDRGIEVVRGRIKSFSFKKVSLPEGRHKIVILDEADSITPAAQQALRRIVEIHSDTTRFILCCNTSEKIIEPVQSRCVVLRFSRLQDCDVAARLQTICFKEGVPSTEDGIKALCFTANGDMRQGINNLQATFYARSLVCAENVYEICDTPSPEQITAIVRACIEKEFDKAMAELQRLLSTGLAKIDVIATFFRVVKNLPREELADDARLAFVREIGTTQLRVLEGIDAFQLEGMVSRLCSWFTE